MKLAPGALQIRLLLLVVLFLYPQVYNVRGLKTERTKTAEMTRGPEYHQ